MTTIEKVARTWDIAPDVAADVRTWADRLGCWDSDLVGTLLTFGLAELAAGRLVIQRTPVLFELHGVAPRGRRRAK